MWKCNLQKLQLDCRPIFEMLGYTFPVAKGNNEKGKNENK